MPFSNLRHLNRAVECRTATSEPEISHTSVLVKDAWQYVNLWLRRQKGPPSEALFYWEQAESFFKASENLPAVSSPLTSYYCFLNALKTLLLVKSKAHADHHGVSGDIPTDANRSLQNEQVTIQGGGILGALTSYLDEQETDRMHTLKDILANLPFIHRAFCLTYVSQTDRFLPLTNPRYVRKDNSKESWFCAEIPEQYCRAVSLNSLPTDFELDEGAETPNVIRTRRRFDWYVHGSNQPSKDLAVKRLQGFHKGLRKDVVFISSTTNLWYLKRRVAGAKNIDRHSMTLIVAAMHRLSELARYDPGGLAKHLAGKANWLLSEFIEMAPRQFLNEVASEITGLEFRLPGIRM